jgi:hypothetical protein
MEAVDETAPLAVAGDGVMIEATERSTLQELLGNLDLQPNYYIPCRATWSMHHLLAYLVRLAGPSKVWLTSWTITEGPVRSILQLVDAGLITQLRCVFDERVMKQNANAAQLAMANIAEIGFTGIHAKCMVVMGNERCFTVCSTANITRNKRIELYWLCTVKRTAEFHAEWIDGIRAEAHKLPGHG